MKKSTLKTVFSILLCLFICSCSNDDNQYDIITNSSESKTEEQIMVDFPKKIQKSISSTNEIITYSGNTTRRITASNQKTLVHQSIAGVGGIYFCDIYHVEAKLPHPSYGSYHSVIDNSCGYHIPSISSISNKLARATLVSDDPFTGQVTLTTSFIFIKYNSIGKSINKWYPYNPDKVVLKYLWTK